MKGKLQDILVALLFLPWLVALVAAATTAGILTWIARPFDAITDWLWHGGL